MTLLQITPPHPQISLLCHSHLAKLQHLPNTCSAPITAAAKRCQRKSCNLQSDFTLNSWTQISQWGISTVCFHGKGAFSLSKVVLYALKILYAPLLSWCPHLTIHLETKSHKTRMPSSSHHQGLATCLLLSSFPTPSFLMCWVMFSLLIRLILPHVFQLQSSLSLSKAFLLQPSHLCGCVIHS